MADRQDIDALLIGALYGELDGDERARLEAHLASHPQDRSALDGLRSTRELLREAHLPVALAVEEPSPAITAMLLQEAARRAPAPASRTGFFAFLAGLLKPFAASPALSAAAALVLVGGAAGLLYSRGTFRTSEPTVGDQMAHADKLDPSAATATAPSPPPPPAGDITGKVDDYRVALAEGESTGTATAGTAGLDQGLTRGLADEERNESERDARRKNTEVAGDDALAAKGKRAAGGGGAAAGFEAAAPTTTAKLDGNAGPRPGYIAVDKQSKDEPAVLSFDGDRYEAAADPASPADESQVATGTSEKKPVSPPPAPAAGAPQKKIAQQQAPAATRDAGKAGAKPYDPVKTAQLDAWAREQHARMVKLVNAGKCTEAGPIGAEIARKNPDYYQANVANDRAVRACRGYVDRARRAKAEDAKTKAAAPRANAPDSPSEADLETAK